MAKDHGVLKVVKRKIRHKASKAGQCRKKSRGVLGQMTAGAARRILDSANSRDKNSTEGCVYCSEGERGHLRRNLIFRKNQIS